uniref:Ribosomal protein S10 n=1 Tax=Aphanomyces invadans TaxID=157072 RepID=A0A1I9Q6J2_9STRA|nr:ribosomal protein S10 [Aphanomyces invadans]AOQ30680.1 ribosomal protein S10 [Aphanomyces invadans]
MYNLKITIKSLKNIDNIKIKYLYKIKQFLKNNNIIIKENIQKKKNTIYTVLRSPHVNKKSMEHFNYNFYKKNFYILNDNFYTLIYFLIILKKNLPENILIKTQIKKN